MFCAKHISDDVAELIMYSHKIELFFSVEKSGGMANTRGWAIFVSYLTRYINRFEV